MIIDWSLKTIKEEVDKIRFAESDPRMDGFVTWGCKKELYEVLWYIEDTLEKCSTYADEEEFVKAREINRMWDIMKGDK